MSGEDHEMQGKSGKPSWSNLIIVVSVVAVLVGCIAFVAYEADKHEPPPKAPTLGDVAWIYPTPACQAEIADYSSNMEMHNLGRRVLPAPLSAVCVSAAPVIVEAQEFSGCRKLIQDFNVEMSAHNQHGTPKPAVLSEKCLRYIDYQPGIGLKEDEAK
jgi:hypothetical protein